MENGAAQDGGRRDPRLEPTPPGLRLQRARPRPAMVVSPVSLTPEQVALPPGARPKMPTLVGLGAAIGEMLAREGRAARSDGSEEAAGSDVVVDASAPTGAEAPSPGQAASLANAPAELDASAKLQRAAELLASFALELSLGPLAGAWAVEARPAVVALQATAEERQQPALQAVLARLLELLPSEPSRPASLDGSLPEPLLLDGSLREHVLHEVSRLAGLLPEWPAAAQDLAEEARRREIRIIHELLLSVDGTRRDQRARLEQQVRLDALTGMSAEALAQELAAPVERGAELRRVLDAYLERRRSSAPDPGKRLGLARALEALEGAARAFEDADPERKDLQRELRGARRDAMTALNLLLAECGAHDLLELLEPLSVAERIERLQHWLSAEGAGADGSSAA